MTVTCLIAASSSDWPNLALCTAVFSTRIVSNIAAADIVAAKRF